MKEKISVLGAGAWGLALAHTLMDNGHEVLLWTIDEEAVKEINEEHKIEKYLKGFNIKFNDNIKATTSLEEAVNFAKYIIVTLPTQIIRKVLTGLKLTEPKVFINGSKGIEISTGMTISEVLEDILDKNYLEGNVTLSGPSHAEEVSQRMATAVTVSCKEIEIAKKVRSLFSNNYFKLYVSTQQKDIELAAALKNVFAIGSGIAAGMGLGDNSKAALVARGLVEMIRFTKSYTNNETALFGLAGLGDLVVTAYSNHSRNFTFGRYIGEGKTVEEAIKLVGATIEGLQTLKVLNKLAKERGIEMPIAEGIYSVIYENKNPKDAIAKLMLRENLYDNNY
ncbi:MAG: NAD(P)-dependent glycerol-3-phosphate dehydrogenase [Erysipelotrichaceae bacterium]|nr:NAD(P)-dependent glycerol-3-phosphate dehydrogenase [Erysipelotrichaceae bacterium]